MTIKKPPLLGNRSVEDKLADIEQSDQINNESTTLQGPITREGELLKNNIPPSFQVEQVMKQYRLKKETRGVRVDLDEDLHTELKIVCIRSGKTMEEYLTDLISGAVKKDKKRFDT